jgi:molybdate transport system substrate-binding protein
MCAPFFRSAVFSCVLFAVFFAALAGCAKKSSEKSPAPAEARPLRVAAASDLEPAFTELGRRYTQKLGRKVVFSFASSSVLAQQVERGAPFDLYAAANAALIEKLEAGGHIVAGSRRPYARGRLVMIARPGLPPPDSPQSLVDPRYARIAVANPEHAPYAQAAVESLRKAGLYAALSPRLVFGENVRQAHQYAETGNADVVIGALSLLKSPAPPHTVVPEGLHPPLLQVLGIVKNGDETAAAQLVTLILDEEGQKILLRHGFLPPPRVFRHKPQATF